jgi:hypothetical protein
MKNVGSFYVHLEYLTAIRQILCHLVGFVVIWNFFPVLVCCAKEKSGNPAVSALESPFKQKHRIE